LFYRKADGHPDTTRGTYHIKLAPYNRYMQNLSPPHAWLAAIEQEKDEQKGCPFFLTHYQCDCIKISFGLTGSLTQSVEYLPFKQRVARSSRARPTSSPVLIV
jgi:hypothetical protein